MRFHPTQAAKATLAVKGFLIPNHSANTLNLSFKLNSTTGCSMSTIRFPPPPPPPPAVNNSACFIKTTTVRFHGGARMFTTTKAFARRSTNSHTALVNNEARTAENNLYEVLRVKQCASSIEIKTAYRNLAKRFHPDVLLDTISAKSSSSDNFIAIHDAYETLSDPKARAHYDISINLLETQERKFRSYKAVNRNYAYHQASGRRRTTTTRRWETDQCW